MRFEGKKKMMVMEVSQKRIEILEYIHGTSPLKITHYVNAERPGGEPSEVARFLRNLLEEKGISAKKAKVIFTAPTIEHKIITLPHTSKEERKLLVNRKLEEELRIPLSELAVSSKAVGKKEERGTDKEEVLVVSTPQFEVKRLLFTLIEAEIEPVEVTSLPVACSLLHPLPEKDDYIAHVSLSREKSFVTISENRFPRFSREINVEFPDEPVKNNVVNFHMLEVEEKGDTVTGPAQRIVTELTRSFLYFKQLSRGGTVRRVYFLGERAERNLGEHIEGKLAVECAWPESDLSGKIDFIGVDEEETKVFSLNHAAHLVILALEEDNKDRINLLPSEYMGRKKKMVDRVLLAGLASAFFLINAFLIIGMLSAKSHYQTVISEIKGQYAHLDQNRNYALKIYSLKEKARISEEILQDVRHPFTSWEDYFGIMSQGTPGGVTYRDMTFVKGVDSYQVSLKGTVAAMYPEQVQTVFNKFYAACAKNPFIKELKYSPVSIYPVENYRHKYEEQFLVNMNLIREGP